MQKIVSVIVALFIFSGSFAQTKLIEKVTKKGDEIVIPYEKYELPNGLTVVLHEDHSLSLLHIFEPTRLR